MNKKIAGRARRARKIRARQAGKVVLRVTRSGRHISAQIFSEDASKVLASASTLGKSSGVSGYTGNCDAAGCGWNSGSLQDQAIPEGGGKP